MVIKGGSFLDCNHCGTTNASHALYCVHDGHPLYQQEPHGRLQAQSYCSACGAIINHNAARYCGKCGSSLDVYESSKTRFSRHTYFDFNLVRSVLPGLFLSIVMLLGLSQIILGAIRDNTEPGDFWNAQLPITPESLNVLNMTLFANLTSLSISMENDQFSQQIIYISAGMSYILIFAVLSLIAGGFLIKWLHPLIDEWKAAIFVAVGYAMLLVIISPLSGAENIDQGNNQVSFAFNTFSALVNGLFIGFMFSYASMVLRKGRLKEKMRVFVYQRALYYGVFVFLAGYGVMLVISSFLTAQYEPPAEWGEMGDATMIDNLMNAVFIVRMAVYLFNFSVLNTFVLNNPDFEEKSTFSFLSGFSNNAETMGWTYDIPPQFFDSNEIVFIIITAALFIMTGRLLVASGQQKMLKSIVVYSIVFAVIMTFFSFNVSMNQIIQHQAQQMEHDNMSFFTGFEIIRTFAVSMIYAMVTALIGALTRKIF
ncbi:zinc ribbon domain-containing protein [Lentibacillus sp. CBA3610]|uniref:zinc ribbon domain-containing protein n=1 Tax=Lentibacillus sp. CBA3610 TaxID=2518176 RepID=UPI001595D226|nr:zinc ribbon domain-containing protein [Lentibacillus sp. CBA3610]